MTEETYCDMDNSPVPNSNLDVDEGTETPPNKED